MKFINSTDPDYITAENARLLKQSLCPHIETKTQTFKNGKYSTRCINCKMVISSDSTETPDKIWIEVIL